MHYPGILFHSCGDAVTNLAIQSVWHLIEMFTCISTSGIRTEAFYITTRTASNVGKSDRNTDKLYPRVFERQGMCCVINKQE